MPIEYGAFLPYLHALIFCIGDGPYVLEEAEMRLVVDYEKSSSFVSWRRINAQ